MNPHPAATLIGLQVVATSRTLSSGLPLTGVILPPIGDGAPRLHDDDTVTVLGPYGWHVVPLVGLAERKKDRRRTECPDGRPLYRHGDLPAQQLATATMLRRARRRRDVDQAPIASYWTGRDYVPLYAVADSIALPPLPPARQAAWDAARTCVTCGATGDLRFGFGPDGARHCEPCQEPAAETWWHTQRAADRIKAGIWARSVLADPTTLLVYRMRTVPSSDLRVENLTGEVLLSMTLRPGINEDRPSLAEFAARYWPPEKLASYTDPIDAVDQVREVMSGRRLIVWESTLDGLERMMLAVGAELALPIRDDDRFGPYWDGWKGEQSRHGSRTYLGNQRVERQPMPDQPAEILAFMRAGLTEMAQHTPPASGTPAEQ